MKKNIIKEVQRSLSYLIEDEEIRCLMVKLVHSGITAEQVANHTREVVIKHLLLTGNY